MRYLSFPNENNRYASSTIKELDAKLAEEGWAIGRSVYAALIKGYGNCLDGDKDLAEAQICSMMAAFVKAEMTGA